MSPIVIFNGSVIFFHAQNPPTEYLEKFYLFKQKKRCGKVEKTGSRTHVVGNLKMFYQITFHKHSYGRSASIFIRKFKINEFKTGRKEKNDDDDDVFVKRGGEIP